MPEPITVAVTTAIATVASQKFLEKASDSGGKWLTDFFAHHLPASQRKAEANVESFLRELAQDLERLEKENVLSADQISSAQEHPDFSVLLQKAMLSAAQTDSEERHKLLSRLVSERIKAPSESLIASATKLACDAISDTTSDHLKMLGLINVINYLQPPRVDTDEQVYNFFQMRLGAFREVRPRPIDYDHLEALSCLTFERFDSKGLEECLTANCSGRFNYEAFAKSDLGKEILVIWENHRLKRAFSTTIGQLIGTMVIDEVTGVTTSLEKWG